VTGGWDYADSGDAAGKVISAEQRRSARSAEKAAEVIRVLCHKELAFEILNLFELRGSEWDRCLLVRERGRDGLRLESGLATVGHERDAARLGDVLQVGGDARAAVHGDGSGVL